MGKKSKKNSTRKGSGQTRKPSSSSSVPVVKTDTNDEKPSAVTMFPCRHSEKGINIANLKSGLQKGADFQCLACSRNKGKPKPKNNPRSKGKAKKLPEDDNKSLWVCLTCGLVSCGSEGDDKSHSWQHYLYQRHPYALVCDHSDQTSLQGWCFPCQMSFLPNDADHQIHNQAFSIVRRYLSREILIDEEHSHSRPHSPLFTPRTSILECGGGYVARGLVNLGNTCFFNSVVQNLLALDTLRKHFLKPNDTPEGRITSALRKLYAETSNEVSGENEVGYKRLGKGSGVLNPKPLFSAVCSKASQFLGYQQQDSHELLRYLVVNLQAEEASCKKGIRDDDSDSKSSNSQEDALVDRVFRGELCSTISCKKCGYSSVVHEPFYDLSLSIPTKLVAKKAPPRPKAGLNTKLRARPKIKNKGVEISERRSSSSKSSSNDANSRVSLSSTAASSRLSISSTAASSRLSISSTAARQGSSDNASEHDSPIVESSVFYGPYLPENVSQKEPSAEPESIPWLDYYDSSSCAHDSWELNSLVHGNQPESHDSSSLELHSFEHGNQPEIHDNSGLELKSFEHGNQPDLEINTSEQGNQPDSHANSRLEADTCEQGNQLDSHVHTGLEINSIRHGKKPDSDVKSGVEISSIRCGNQPDSHVNSGLELNSFENGDRVDAHISSGGSEISCRLPESIEIEDVPLPVLGDSEVIMLPYNETNLIGYEGSGDHLGAKESGTVSEPKEDEVELDGIGQLFDGEEDYFAESKGQEEGSSGSFLFDKNSCEDLEQEADCNYPMSVDGCLGHFTMTEILSGDNAWRCENCASIARNVCIDLDRTGKGQEEIHVGDELSELGKPKNIEKLPRIDDTPLEILMLDTNNEEDNYSRLSGIVEETFDVTDRTECDRSEASVIANLIDPEKGESSEKSTGSFSSTEVQLSDCDGHQLNGEVSDKENTQTSISHGDKITDSVSFPDCLLQSRFNNYSNEEEGSVVCLQTDKSSSSEILSSPNVEDRLEMSSMESDELQYQRVRQTVKAQRHQRRKAKKNATGVDGENVDKQCNEANGVFQEATKRFLISKAPLVLTIHLNRFSQDMRGQTSKLSGHVGFQDILDLRPFLDPRCPEKENCIYQLTGVVEHSGTMRGGHYVAYVRCYQGAFNIDNKSDISSGNVSWCCISDAYVRSVTLSEVLQSEAYLLFYERCGKSDTDTTSLE